MGKLSNPSRRGRAWAVVVVLALIAAGPGFAGRAGDVRTQAFRDLAQGITAYKNGDFPGAVDKLRAAANAALNNFRAHFYLGLALIGDRRYQDAIGVLEIAVELDPGHLQSHVAIGDAWLKLGDLNEARASYHRALKIRPAYPAGLDGLGRVSEAQAKDEEAIAFFRQAIASDRGFAEAYTHLGDLYLRQGRFEEAVLLLNEAVSIRPDYAPGLNRLALAFGRLGLDNQAIATINRAIELEPKSAEHPTTLGQLELEKGFLGAAEQSFRKALALDPALPWARLGLGEVARRRGEYERAIEEVETALADERLDAAARARLTGFRDRVVAERESLARLEARSASGEASPEEFAELALIYAGRGQWAEAAQLEAKAPDSPLQRERLAYMLFQAGDYAEAHRLYEALAADSGATKMALNNGVTLALLGNDTAAIGAYRQALAAEPTHAQALLFLGNALLRSGHKQEAVEAYKQYLTDNSRGEAAERVRRILKQVAPEALPAPVEVPVPPPQPTEEPPAGEEGS